MVDRRGYRDDMRVGRWLRWSAGFLLAALTWLVVFAVSIALAIGLTLPAVVGAATLDGNRRLVTDGRHGTVTVRRCEQPGGSGDWECVGRFVSDDTEMAVDDVTVGVEQRPGERVEGWLRSPYDTEVVTDPTVVPNWIVVALIVLAFIGYGAGYIVAVFGAARVAGRVRHRFR